MAVNQNFCTFLLFILLPAIHGDFENSVLDEHNRYRAKHNTPKLTLNADLSSGCASYAKEIAAKNSLDHSIGNYGENLCVRSSNPVECVKMWYDEMKDYDFKKPKFSSATGHFTQMLWRSSKEMGVGKAKSSGGLIYVVARYKPAGNVVGKFKENVLPLGGTKPECSYLIMLLWVILFLFK
ncbi:Golgi-associated plant pathogenesis-related protein 1-like [Scaptodrosophila lebanonensis]|uniref:Golgi-associated plant pathogenesis-related protein 1-like n=1 Tax=Drosophila lebanonensis TaxID=7225 RepID=A0A6J2TEN0_DROLE|nr:Golgi-associated plant pathogenesis-related protein 1-like [Scaptodrosophila lebanonensis]